MREQSLPLVERVERAVRSSLRGVTALKPGVTVVVAVSGGPDSLCLLYVLQRLSRDSGVLLHVAHLDHMLRGRQSQEDADFVRSQAESLGLHCTVEARDVSGYREAHRCSLEEAAREVRYRFLSDVARSVDAVAVVTGHTRDDAVETILLHILRGAGVHGLRGLEVVSRYPRVGEQGVDEWRPLLLRPLLQLTRDDTQEYCHALGLHAREDASNVCVTYLRNRIRRELLPSMRRLNPRVDDALVRLGRHAAEDDDCLESIARAQWGRIARVADDCIEIDLVQFRESPPAIQSRLILHAMVYLTGSTRDVSAAHITAVRRMSDDTAGRHLDLPCGIVWRRQGVKLVGGRWVALVRDAGEGMQEEPRELTVPGELPVPGGRIVARVVTAEHGPLASSSPAYVALLDADRTGERVWIRRRRPGDRFQPLGMVHEKKLQDFMVDAHIPADVRDRIPIVCSSSQIIWVAGWRIDDRVRVTADTCRMLRLEFVPTP